MAPQAFEAHERITRRDATGTRLPGVHNYHALTHKNARFLPVPSLLLEEPVPLPDTESNTQRYSWARNPLPNGSSLEGSAALKDRRGAPVRADPPLRQLTPLSSSSSAPSGHHAPLSWIATPFRSLNTLASSPR